MSPLDRQLRLLRAYALVTYPFACVPFLFLFFRDHGMDEGDYGVIVGAYYLAMFVAEVPTGVLADRFGPKRMLVLGPLLLATGFLTLAVAPSHAGFIAGEVLLGLGHAVLSGPPATMLYETLREHGVPHRYLAEEGRINARRLLGTGASFLLGGALARFGSGTGDAWLLTIVATAVLCAVAACIGSALHAGPGPSTVRPLEFLQHARRDLALPSVRWLLVYWIVLFTLLRYPFHNYQPWLAAAGEQQPLLLDPMFVGVLFAAMNLAAAPMSSLLPRLVQRHGRVPLFWGMPMLLCASLLVMAVERQIAAPGLVWLGVAMFFVQQLPFGMHWALLQEFVNHRIQSTARTTVMSALSLGTRCVYAACNMALFAAQATHGMATVLTFTAVVGALATAAVLLLRPRGLLRGDGPAGT